MPKLHKKTPLTTQPLNEIVQKSTLPNGIRVLTEQMPGARSFALGIWIDVGSRDENQTQQGVCHFIEHAVFRGAAGRSSRQLANRFENFGGYVDAYTTKEHTCYYVRALTEHFDESLALLTETVLQPMFRPADVEKERSVILEEIAMLEDEPEELIFEALDEILFPRHRVAHPISGSPQTLNGMTADDLRAYHQRHYHAGAIVIATAGAIPHENVYRAAQKKLGATPKFRRTARRVPVNTPAASIRMTKPASQTHIVFGILLTDLTRRDRSILALLNTILGDGMSSRLNQSIRERRGMAYNVYSSLSELRDCIVMNVYAAVKPSNCAKIARLIQKEAHAFAAKPVSGAELKRAVEQAKSSVIMSLESVSGRMQALAKSELYYGDFEDPDVLIAELESITAAEIRSFARDRLQWERWRSAILDPED